MSSSPSARAAVLVFVRAPERGRVKTRLAAGIGADAALSVYRRLAEHTVAEALGAGAAVRAHVTPDGAAAQVAAWLGEGPLYLPQGEGDLGARMERAFAEAFAAGHGPVAIVGSDLPGLSADLLRRALALLEHHDAVVGPAADGGYYLLALRGACPALFRGVPWSTERVLPVTLERLREAGLGTAVLEELRDVDEAEDLPAGWAAET